MIRRGPARIRVAPLVDDGEPAGYTTVGWVDPVDEDTWDVDTEPITIPAGGPITWTTAVCIGGGIAGALGLGMGALAGFDAAVKAAEEAARQELIDRIATTLDIPLDVLGLGSIGVGTSYHDADQADIIADLVAPRWSHRAWDHYFTAPPRPNAAPVTYRHTCRWCAEPIWQCLPIACDRRWHDLRWPHSHGCPGTFCDPPEPGGEHEPDWWFL